MAIKPRMKTIDYPSFEGVDLFWKKAVEEFEKNDIISQKDGCEKAYRSATEAVDLFLTSRGYYVPVGKPEAHIVREEYLVELYDLEPEMKIILQEYSTFKNFLHGLCFYTGVDPKKYQKIFYSVEQFNARIYDYIRDLH